MERATENGRLGAKIRSADDGWRQGEKRKQEDGEMEGVVNRQIG